MRGSPPLMWAEMLAQENRVAINLLLMGSKCLKN